MAYIWACDIYYLNYARKANIIYCSARFAFVENIKTDYISNSIFQHMLKISSHDSCSSGSYMKRITGDIHVRNKWVYNPKP